MVGNLTNTTRVRNAVAAVLPRNARVIVEPRREQATSLFHVTIHVGSGEHRFLAEWAGEGWPADVERLTGAVPEIDIVVARQLSRGAKEWLLSHQRGWVGEDGDANVSLSTGLIISRDARPSVVTREAPTKWTRTMLASAEAIFAGVSPTVESVEAATGISRGASANALARMEKLGLLQRPRAKRGRASARSVVDHDSFLHAYATAAAKFRLAQPTIRVHRLWEDPLVILESEIGPSLSHASSSWALTGVAASILLAPYLSRVTVVELYVDDDLFANPHHVADVLGGRVVDRGQVIEVRALPTPMSVTGPVVHGVHVALPARVYADLLALGGRSAEAAVHLRESIDVGPPS